MDITREHHDLMHAGAGVLREHPHFLPLLESLHSSAVYHRQVADDLDALTTVAGPLPELRAAHSHHLGRLTWMRGMDVAEAAWDDHAARVVREQEQVSSLAERVRCASVAASAIPGAQARERSAANAVELFRAQMMVAIGEAIAAKPKVNPKAVTSERCPHCFDGVAANGEHCWPCGASGLRVAS